VVHFGRTGSEKQAIHAYIPAPEKSTFVFVGDRTGPLMISPDGTRLVFSARGPDGKQQLWLRPLQSASAQPLAGTEGATFPFWSADSRSVGFFTEGKLKKIDAAGGPAQVLCDALDGRGGSWNRDGIILFAPIFNGPIYEVSAGGGTPEQVTELDVSKQENSHRFPQFLPDGRHFLYLVRSVQGMGPGIHVGSLDRKEKKLLFRNRSNAVYAVSGYLLFVRENTLMAQAFDSKNLKVHGDAIPIGEGVLVNEPYSRSILSVSDNGILAYGGSGAATPSRLRWLDQTGKQIGTVGDAGAYSNPRLSPDGTKLAVAIGDISRSATDIWICDLVRGGKTRLTFDPSLNYSPIWSPDGRQIVFSSTRKAGFSQLFRKAANGEGSDELLLDSPNTTDRPDDWSPDGRFIVYEPNFAVGSLWLLPLFGERKTSAFLSGDSGTFPGEGMFSRDGKWLAFTEYSAGKREVYITSFPGKTGKWQVSVGGGHYPQWRGDGKELFFLAQDNATVMAADLDLTGVVPRVGTAKALFTVNLATILQNRLGSAWDPFDVTADGQRFLVNSVDQPQAAEPINVVINWDAELKK
jgi:Tol biopolymer transport system component